MTPGGAASNAFDLALTDYDTGAPADASAADLRFEVASLSGVAASTLDLTRTSAGHYTGTGANLSIDGIWRVTVTVDAAGRRRRVPLVVATKVADQAVQQLVLARPPDDLPGHARRDRLGAGLPRSGKPGTTTST